MPYIYKIENKLNNKLYIGKTLYAIERRWYQHKNNVKNKYYKNRSLYIDMDKYGVDNFAISCVEEVKDVSILAEREKFWIDYYNSYEDGYNESHGGEGRILYDYDYIWDLWESGMTIKQISDCVKCNDYVVRTVLDINNVPTEERNKRSANDQLNSHVPYQREVLQIDISTNEILKTFPSVSAAARNINCDSSSLSKVCAKGGTSHGYKWEYSDKEYEIKDFSPRKVCKIDLKTNDLLEVFESISAAARSVDGDTSYISGVCRGKYKSSKGFGWAFYDGYINEVQ